MTAIRNPTRNLLFNALPDYMQGRGRALLMALVLPVAVMTTGGFLHAVRLIDNTSVFLVTGFVASLIYLYFSTRINRAYIRTILSTLKERVFLPENNLDDVLKGGGEQLYDELVAGLDHDDVEIALAHASMLARGYPNEALPVILDRIKRADSGLGARLLDIVRHLDLSQHQQTLRTYLADADDPFQATIYSLLFACREMAAENKVEFFLNSANPKHQATGVYGVFQYGREDLYVAANAVLGKLLHHSNPEFVLAGLDLLHRHPVKEQYSILTNVLDHVDPEIQRAALEVVSQWPDSPSEEWLLKIKALCDSIDPKVRMACAKSLSRNNEDQAGEILFELLEDRHPSVRRAAVNSLKTVLPDASAVLIEWILKNSGSPRAQQSVLDGIDREIVGVDLFLKVAETKLNDAKRCRSLLLLILASQGKKSSASELAIHVLRERIQQYTNVILGVMEFLEDTVTLNVIRAGLQSGDPRQVANACEALSELKHQELANGLEKLYGPEQGTVMESTRWFSQPSDGLRWVAENLDPWMKEVATRALVAG